MEGTSSADARAKSFSKFLDKARLITKDENRWKHFCLFGTTLAFLNKMNASRLRLGALNSFAWRLNLLRGQKWIKRALDKSWHWLLVEGSRQGLLCLAWFDICRLLIWLAQHFGKGFVLICLRCTGRVSGSQKRWLKSISWMHSRASETLFLLEIYD